MSDTDSVTISLLPVSLSLVHLPRSRLQDFTQHVLRQILTPNPTFLNVTCNEVEVSLFAEHDTLQDFHKAAKKDARRLRRRERDASLDAPSSPLNLRRMKGDWEPVEVTFERWKVLQIDSHSDTLGTYALCAMFCFSQFIPTPRLLRDVQTLLARECMNSPLLLPPRAFPSSTSPRT